MLYILFIKNILLLEILYTFLSKYFGYFIYSIHNIRSDLGVTIIFIGDNQFILFIYTDYGFLYIFNLVAEGTYLWVQVNRQGLLFC